MEKKDRPQNKNLTPGNPATQFAPKGSTYGRDAVEAQKASRRAIKEKTDFKRKCQIWMETEVAKDKNGNPMTGADLMIAVAGKEIKNGSAKFWELVRDTAGFKPVDKVMVAEVEQSVIDEIEAMVEDASDDGIPDET